MISIKKFAQLMIHPPKTFNLNKYMLRLGLVNGYYDGEKIVKDRKWYLYQILVQSVRILSVARFAITFICPKEHIIQTYLADLFNYLPYTDRLFMLATGNLFVYWATSVGLTFLQMNRHPELTRWMRFMPHTQPLKPYTFIAYPADMRVKFITKTSVWLYRLNAIMLVVAVLLINIIYYNYYFLVSLLPTWQFVPLYIFHISAVNVYATQMILLLIVLSSCMSILCQLFSKRYAYLKDQFACLAGTSQQCYLSHRTLSSPAKSQISPERHCCVNLKKLHKLIVGFNTLSLEVLQTNRFWCRIILINNIFGLLLIVVGLFASIYAENFYAVFPVASLMIFLYFIVFFYQIVVAGEIVVQANRNLMPIQKLLIMDGIPFRYKFKLIEIINYVNSNYCGFSCYNLFVIRQINVVHITIFVIIHIMLIYDIMF